MANEVQFYIGSFQLEDSANHICIADIKVQIAKAIQENALPKAHGSIIPIGKRKSIIVALKGSITGTDYDNLRTNLDALKAALESTAEQKLTLDNDRYLMVQYRNFAYEYVMLRTFAEFTFDVIASYPFWLSETLTTDTGSRTTAVAFTVNNPGNTTARAKITVTAGGSPIADDIEIANATTGEAFNYRGTLAATKVLTVDNKVAQTALQVLNDGSDNIVNFEGDFITLAPGNNSITLTTTSGPLTVAVIYRATYL